MYQVPKIKVDVEVVANHEREIKGAIFISENQISYAGKPRLEDFLNQQEQFFPFADADGSYSLLNKPQLIFIRSSEDDSKVLIEQLMLQPRNVEVHFVDGKSLEGVIYSNLPKESLRVSDFFNQSETFLPMYQGEQKIIMNTNQIVYVKD